MTWLLLRRVRWPRRVLRCWRALAGACRLVRVQHILPLGPQQTPVDAARLVAPAEQPQGANGRHLDKGLRVALQLAQALDQPRGFRKSETDVLAARRDAAGDGQAHLGLVPAVNVWAARDIQDV
jgi:hypothetical protein